MRQRRGHVGSIEKRRILIHLLVNYEKTPEGDDSIEVNLLAERNGERVPRTLLTGGCFGQRSLI